MNKFYLFCVVALSLPFINGFKLSQYTEDEIHKVIANSLEDESSYDIAPVVHTLHKRDISPTLRLKAFQQDIKLYLEPNDGLLFGTETPVYLARKNQTEIGYTLYNHNENFKLYQDLTRNTALMIEKSIEGKYVVRGMINNLYIHPIPESLNAEVRKKRSTDSVDPLIVDDNEIYTSDHIVIRMENKPKTAQEGSFNKQRMNTFLQNLIDLVKNERETYYDQFLNANFSRVYPKILVATDFKTFSDHKRDIGNFIKYMAIFWNGVDLKFRALSDPEVRLHISGLIIPMEKGVSPYTEKFNIDGDKIWDAESLDELNKHFILDNFFKKNTYDIAVAITNNDMIMYDGNGYSSDPNGISYFAQACQINSVALVEDDGKFGGVLTTVHELGHVLGASHDGSPSIIPSIPGAVNCPFDDGYIMSYVFKNENSQRWSSCSINSMQTFLKSDGTTCLRKKPKASSPYPKFIPGSVASLREQCEASFPGHVPCENINRNVCHELYCKKPNSLTCVTRGAALEGSPCKNGICLWGDCVPLPRNFVQY